MTTPSEPSAAKRLAFVLPNLGGGGAERVALALIADFLARGFEIDLVLMQASGELLPLVPAEVRIIDLKAARIRSAIRPLARYLQERRPAAVQASMWPLTSAAVVARALSRTKSRLVLSDHAVLSSQYAGRGILHDWLVSSTIRYLYSLADARIVVANDTATDLSRLSGLPVTRFETIYNPVEPPRAMAKSFDPKTYWPGSGVRLLNVGRLAPQKNQRLLLQALARLPDAQLVILGERALRSELESEARSLGVADRVSMPGFILDAGAFFHAADLFVLSSDYEGYPVVLLEALHAGLPIVSTDCPSGPAEILDGGRFGRLAACGDAATFAEQIKAEVATVRRREDLQARAAGLIRGTADRYLELMLGQSVDGVRNVAAK